MIHRNIEDIQKSGHSNVINPFLRSTSIKIAGYQSLKGQKAIEKQPFYLMIEVQHFSFLLFEI